MLEWIGETVPVVGYFVALPLIAGVVDAAGRVLSRRRAGGAR